jgi:serine-type D-Ala-D-Ala carboxypeptidase/endopeptidase (penicillin-binding protein 4)
MPLRGPPGLAVAVGKSGMRLLTCALSAMLALGAFAAASEDRPAGAPTGAVPKGVVLGAAFGFAASDFGYLVVDLADGAVLAEHNADRPFMPASVVKIPTAAAALDILGRDHRFETAVLVEGEVVDGVLDGALTIRGGGDPLLTGDDLQALARDIARSGIKQVAGGFHYDATQLVETPQINPLQPQAAGYNPGVSALSVNFNRIRLAWRNGGGKGPSGAAKAISDNVTLPLDAIGFAPAEAALPGPFARAGEPFEDRWLLSPALAPSGEDWLPVGNPSLVAAEMLRQLAAKEGVTMPAPTARAVGPEAREIARHESDGLADILRRVLYSSNNMAAELIGLAASRAVTGRPLPLEASAETLSNYWRLRNPGLDWEGFFLENHSGLSSRSRASPRQLVAILESAADPAGGTDLHALLRSASWKAPNGQTVRIRAKTGTIVYGRGLAGYIDAVDGRRLAFAVLVNDEERRAALDAAFDPRARTEDPAWRPWRARALKLEETLLNGWATGS